MNHSQALTDYLSAGGTSSGTNGEYAGVTCSSWQAVIAASTPTANPSGSTVLINDNDPYLTDINGTAVYKNVKTTYSF